MGSALPVVPVFDALGDGGIADLRAQLRASGAVLDRLDLARQILAVRQATPPAHLEAKRQTREVERRYADVLQAHDEEGQPLPAPNGQPSNLNRRQWVQVRTVNFKNWFGDWAHDENAPVTVTKVSRDPSAPHGNSAHLWRVYAKQILRGKTAVVADNGVTVAFPMAGIEASIKNRNKDARSLYASLPEVLSNASYLGYTENTKTDEKPGIVGYEHYVAAVELDGVVREVALTVDLVRDWTRGRGYYYHQVSDVDIGGAVGYSRGL